MTDWSAALALAFKRHLPAESGVMQPPTVAAPAPAFRSGRGTAGTTQLQQAVLGAIPCESMKPLGFLTPGTTGTAGTTRIAPDVQSTMSEASAAELDERAALVEYGADVPREWAEGFASLDLRSRRLNYRSGREVQLTNDAGRFLDEWGREAARLGWSVADVFGVDADHLDGSAQPAGLVPLIRGGQVVSVAVDRATIQMPDCGCCVVYLRRPRAGLVSYWERESGSELSPENQS